jgi:hypothetical protein
VGRGAWGVGVVRCTLPPAEALRLCGHAPALATDPQACALAYITLYDQRGGGVETPVKEDKQGLGVTKRSKKRFPAQPVVVALGALAHTVLIWAQRWVHAQRPGIARYGVKRLVRDSFGLGGWVALDADGQVTRIVLNQANRLSCWLLTALQTLVSSADVAVTLGET